MGKCSAGQTTHAKGMDQCGRSAKSEAGRRRTYHQRMRMEVMGGRKYQAKASDLSSQFICMGLVIVTPRSWL